MVSASLDGTVRAFDMARYRNFRTFTSPRPAQFGCVAVDSAGELIAAGGTDVYEIYLWSMKTGRLLEVNNQILIRTFQNNNSAVLLIHRSSVVTRVPCLL